jgi:LysR family glycine cleavage system transcriptional activator
MTDNLHHLRALQAFDEAATHASFSKAADRLNVTHGAVSRQIKLLEAYLGVTLFYRRSGGVELTAKGAQLLQSTRPAFATLHKGVSEVKRQHMRQSLKVSLPNAVALKWLVPRLPSFHESHPAIALYLDTADTLTDFDTSEVDVALRFGVPKWDGLYVEKIADEALVAVASAALVADIPLPMAARDIARLPLLHHDYHQGWDNWAKMAGLPPEEISTRNKIKFSESAALLEAAVDRQGVALARQLLVARDIEAGKLVRLDDVLIPLNSGLYFVCRNGDQDRREIRIFKKWVMSIR